MAEKSRRTEYEVYAALHTVLYCMGENLPEQERERAGRLMAELSSKDGTVYLIGEQASGKTRVLRWLLGGSGQEMAPRMVEETYEDGRELLSYREIGVRDTVVFVIRATQPFGMSERAKLVGLLREGRMQRIVFLVNMMNLVEEDERDELLDYLKDRVGTAVEEEIAQESSRTRQEDLCGLQSRIQWEVYRKADTETVRRLQKTLFHEGAADADHLLCQEKLLLEEWRGLLEERMDRRQEQMRLYWTQAESAREHGLLLQKVWEHELMEEKQSPLASFLEEHMGEWLWKFEETFLDKMTQGVAQAVQDELNQAGARIRGQWDSKVRGDFNRILGKKSWSQAIELRMVEVPDRKLAAETVSQIAGRAERVLRGNFEAVAAWLLDIAVQVRKGYQWKIQNLEDYDSDCGELLRLSQQPIPYGVSPDIVPRADELLSCQEIRQFTDQVSGCILSYCEGQQMYKKRLLELVAEKKRRKEADLQVTFQEAEEPCFFWGEIQEIDWQGRLSYEVQTPGDRIFRMPVQEWAEETARRKDLLRDIAAELKKGLVSSLREWADRIDREYAGILQRRMLGRTELLMELNRRMQGCLLESWQKEKQELERIRKGLGACAGIYREAGLPAGR